MAKHLNIDDGDDIAPAMASKPNPAPYGYLKDGVTPRKPPGRPSKAPPVMTPPHAARAEPPLRRLNPRPVPREQPREMAREPSRGNARVIGRDGEELVRMRPDSGGDMYDKVKCPDPEYTYQWNAVSAVGKEMDEMQLQMWANGWRPVPASRHPGIYTAPGYDGQIVVKGLRLEERPKRLTEEATYEDLMRARKLMRDQTDRLRMTQAELPGADIGARGNRVAMKIDRSFTADIPRPQHLPPDDE